VVKTTKSFYNTDCSATPTDSYGNLRCVLEYNNTTSTATRKTLKYYKTTDGPLSGGVWGPYIVDRMWGETIYDGSGGLLALSHMFYDNTTNPNNPALSLSTGELQRVITYYDLPLICCTNPINGLDMTYTYDAYGNRLTERSYAQAGVYTPTTTLWSSPGNNSTARTSTMVYDNLATTTINEATSGLARQSTNPLGQTTRADYDYRMATLIRVTGPNTTGTPTDCSQASINIPPDEETSCAVYDEFGRMVKLVKPGDTSSSPTVQAIYHDTENPLVLPLRYEVKQKDTGGDGVRVSAQFYDGMGRKVQTKAESADGVNAIVSVVNDMRYDGLSRVVAQSQPFYLGEASTNFGYTQPAPSEPLFNQTATTYDGLGRPIRITQPDTFWTEHRYGIVNGLLYDDVVDPNRHRVQHRSDALGRLREVVEINGDCGTSSYSWATCATPYTTGWVAAASTTYGYDALDQLTSVTDAKGNVTSMQYDSLGRKASMSDPDMGNWNYSYDANGNLSSQVDAKNQRICFYYDDLNRLRGKHSQVGGSCPGGLTSGDVFYNYDELAAVNGQGQRTSMSNPNATTQWEYDARGRKTKETYSNVVGLAAGQTRVFQWGYDSADRVTSITYPSTEQVSYTYDAAWRQTNACSSLGCYVGNAANSIPATYTALDQPLKWQFDNGNGAIQQWTYDSPMQRLQRIQVGTAISPYILMHRSYLYDVGGNVKQIGDLGANQTQTFEYDERDRLVHYQTTTGATFGGAALRRDDTRPGCHTEPERPAGIERAGGADRARRSRAEPQPGTSARCAGCSGRSSHECAERSAGPGCAARANKHRRTSGAGGPAQG
jgi:YD repeat-containing protein